MMLVQLGLIFSLLAIALAVPTAAFSAEIPTRQIFNNAFGRLEVFSTDNENGIDTNNPFFKSLGTNGRSCGSCHKLQDALGISTATINDLFKKTAGLDPIFRTVDGSNAPTGFYAQTSTRFQRWRSFSMLLRHGVIRVGIPAVPSGADFNIVSIKDPYRFASPAELSLFRRPLPSVDVAFHTVAMWDGRESEDGRTNIIDALKHQALDATLGHAQASTPPTDAQMSAIADFQLHLFAGQISSKLVGPLNVKGCDVQGPHGDKPGQPCDAARAGGAELSKVLTDGNEDFPAFFPGINDSLNNPDFNHTSFIIFEPWESATLGRHPTVNGKPQKPWLTANRGKIGDGENLFYTKQFNITGVAGLNDALGQQVIVGTCTTCHNTPDVGDHSQPRFFRIGVDSPSPVNNALARNLSDFPNYTFRSNSDGSQVTTTDPGLALRTGKFDDIGRFKVPALRGLAARAPYFHNGAANSLQDVLTFYNKRFNIGFTRAEMDKIILFLEQN
jgi:cytochrome c peroxidase